MAADTKESIIKMSGSQVMNPAERYRPFNENPVQSTSFLDLFHMLLYLFVNFISPLFGVPYPYLVLIYFTLLPYLILEQSKINKSIFYSLTSTTLGGFGKKN